MDTPQPSSPLLGIIYLITVALTLVRSRKRWITLLWIVGGLVLVFALSMLAVLIWPDRAGGIGSLGAIFSMLVSAVLGINHMLAHRCPSPPTTKH